MALFGENAKDQLIAALVDEVRYLRGQVKELQDALLYIRDSAAFRAVHPTEEPPAVAIEPSPFQRRDAPFRPQQSLEEVKEHYGAG